MNSYPSASPTMLSMNDTAPQPPVSHRRNPRLGRPVATLASACAALALSGCGLLSGWMPSWSSAPALPESPFVQQVLAPPHVDVVLLGERHDASEHHALEADLVQAMAARGQLAALAIEMAENGNRTGYLRKGASEDAVRAALSWDEKAWPWAGYGPAVMAAVRAGVPVLGANLPRARMKDAMADVSLDSQLDPGDMERQREAIREGHCNKLPADRIGPMTRIQLARDREMALTVAQAFKQAKEPNQTVLLISGAGHAVRRIGVAQQLPLELKVRTVRMAAGEADATADADFDLVWPTAALPEKDHCAGVK